MKEKRTYQLKSISDLKEVVASLAVDILKHKVVTFEGDLGAGKTTFIKALCHHLGITDLVSSPTFSIVNEYEHPSDALKVYHMDLYRLADEDELINIGFEDYLDSGDLILIEWPQIAKHLLPSNTIGIHIKLFDNSSRRLTLYS